MWEEDSLTRVLGCQGLCLFLLFWDFLLTLVMWRAWQWPVAIGCSGLVWTGLVYLGPALQWLCLDYPQSSVLTMEECYSSCVFVSTQDNCTLSGGQPWNRSTINVCACVDFASFFFDPVLIQQPSSGRKIVFLLFCYSFFPPKLSLRVWQSLTPKQATQARKRSLSWTWFMWGGPSCWWRSEESRGKGRKTRSSSYSNHTSY